MSDHVSSRSAMAKTPAAVGTLQSSGVKRSRPATPCDEEKQRLRDKNRTNSKRFRDRKKSFMDGLFEEKYHLGKANNDLRTDNERLRALLEEARAENVVHKRNAAMGLYSTPQVLPQSSSGLLHVGAQHRSPANVASFRAPKTDDPYVSRRAPSSAEELRPTIIHPALADILYQVDTTTRQQRAIGEITLRDLEQSIKAKMNRQEAAAFIANLF